MNDNTNDTDTENFDSIPDMPSAASIRTELLKTGDPQFWRPHGTPDGTATDFASLGEAGKRVLDARLQLGPGPNGTEWQKALWDYNRKLADLDKEEARILKELGAVKGYDPTSGAPIPASSTDRKRALGHALAQVVDDRVRLEGEPGREALDKKLDEAVKARQLRFKREYIQSEARRRASAKAMDDEIDRLAANFAKTLPKP